MTAEVAILNKMGVALAADSIVTITTQGGDKTYNTANKLFALSKYHPVGIMIWNATDINSVPLELIIKEYRKTLGKNSKPTLKDYSDDFIRHLRSRAHITKDDQLLNFRFIIRDFCRSLKSKYLTERRDRGITALPTLTGDSLKLFNENLDCLKAILQALRKTLIS